MTDNRENEVPQEPRNQWPINPNSNQGQAPVAPQEPQENVNAYTSPVGEPQRPMGYNTPYTPPVGLAPQPNKQNKVLPLVVGFSLISALLGGSIGGIIGSSASQEANGGSSYSAAAPAKDVVNTTNESTSSDLSKIINEKLPSIVTISVIAGDTGGTGSGVVLNDKGYIVTNAHVATVEGQTANGDINVQTSTGDTYKAELVGYDSTSDLAVLKIDPQAEGISPISFASSENLQVGTETIAVGSPLGLSGTVTTGIISALNRPISVTSSEVNGNSSPSNGRGQEQGRGQGQTQQQASVALSAIQTDAAINSGNSGGALLDANGNLIGINVAIASTGETAGSIGVGFAIPSDYVKRVAAEIVASGEATHGYLGAGVVDYNDSNATFTSGAQIESVEPGSAADEAGLRKGDVVTQLNGDNIESAIQLTAVVKQLAPGSSVGIAYERGSEENNITVKLGEVKPN
jgi:putative serine protease PepD